MPARVLLCMWSDLEDLYLRVMGRTAPYRDWTPAGGGGV